MLSYNRQEDKGFEPEKPTEHSIDCLIRKELIMAAKVTRTCVSIVYSVKVYDESNDSVFTKEISIDENDKPEKAIPTELPDYQTAIKFKAIKKVEELREMTSKDYIKHSRAVSRKETVLE